MAIYTYKAPDGRKIRLKGDSPPTEQELESIFASLPESKPTPKAPVLSRAEQMVGGEILDPTTGERSQEQVQDALSIARARGASAQGEIERQARMREDGTLGAVMAGGASVPQGMGELVKAGVVGSGMGTEAQFERAFPEQAKMGEYINEASTASPSAWFPAAGAGAINALTGGRGGSTPLTLAKGAGAAFRGETALAKELLEKSLLEGGVGAGSNVAIGQGLRTATGGETTGSDIVTDLLLGALTSGKRGDVPELPAKNTEETFETMVKKAQERKLLDEAMKNRVGDGLPVTTPQQVAAREAGQVPSIPSQSPSTLDQMGAQLPIVGKAFERRIANKADAARTQMLNAQDAVEIADALSPRSTPTRVSIPPPQGGVGVIRSQAARHESVKAAALDAMDAGIDRGALKQIATSTPEEKTVFSRMAKDARDYAEDNSKPDPSLHIGNEFKTRVEDAEEISNSLAKKTDKLVRKIKPNKMGNARQSAFQRMQSHPSLRGIAIDQDGNLLFERTRLNGPGNASARADIQKNFDALTGKDAEELHYFRQSIADQIDLAKKSGTPLNDVHDIALNSIRQGSMDALGPDYAMLQEMQAKLTRPLTAIKRIYRGLENSSEDILKEKGALLGRRLDNNAQSGPQLRADLEALENAIVEHGGTVNVSIKKLVQGQNLLDEVYGIRKKGSLAGQVKLGSQQAIEGAMEGGRIPTSATDVAVMAAGSVGKSFQRTDAVKRAAFERFLKHIEVPP